MERIMQFDNRITRLLGVEVPIVQAPMGWIARSQLASAVSNAGGLGIIETSSGELDAIREEILKMRVYVCVCVCVYVCVYVYICVCVYVYMCLRLRLHLYVPRVGIGMPRLCHPNVRPFTAASILYTPPTNIYYPTQCVA